jgi:hypothetical protein
MVARIARSPQTQNESNMICPKGFRLEQYMKTARVSLCLAMMVTCALASPALAQQAPPGQGSFGGWPDVSQEGTDDIHTRSIWDNRNFMLRTDGGDGVGYIRGYQTFAAFQPVQIVPDEFILWMSPRGYITYNSGSFAGNLGAGFRWLDKETNRIWGGGAWWDHDNNGTNIYDQLGGSLEWLGKYFDLRANAYIPTNQNVHINSQFLNNNNVFIGNNIGVGQTTITNTALRGGDFEGGGALPGIGELGLRAYAGGYYYQGPESGGGIYGVRSRLEALVTQDMWGTVIWQHDRVFGTTVSGAATFYLFTGNEPRWFKRIPMETRLYQQQERQYRVAVQQNIENDVIVALRAGGTGGSGGPVGTPIFVLHVDNKAAAGGNGTVEHPLNFLPTTTASNVDIIFVHRGTGTSFNMNQGTTLNDWERLLGQGVQHQFTDTLGTFTLPGFSPGPLPTITNINPGGNAVTLASHNEVSGFNIAFNIAGQTNQGIAGSFITDFNINNVNITGAGNSTLAPVNGAAVQLLNATGTGVIASSTFNNNPNADGILVNNSFGGTLDLTIKNVQANNDKNGVDLIASGSTINPTVSNLTASNNALDGISSTLTAGSSMTGTYDQVTADSNNTGSTPTAGFGNGFVYNSDASSGTIAITRSTFSQNHLNGVDFITTGNSSLTASLLNNTSLTALSPNPTFGSSPGIFNNGLNGIVFTNTDSQVTATILNNTIANNGGFGIGVASQGTGAFPSTFNLNAGGYLTQDVNGNGVLDPGENKVAIASLGSTIISNGLLNQEGNTLVGNKGAGISYELLDQATGVANIIGNTIQTTSAGTGPFLGQGIDVRLTGSSTTSSATASMIGGVIDKNTIGSLTDATRGNAGAGIVVFANQNTALQGLAIGTAGVGNIIGNNGGDGINITRGDTSQMGNISPIQITSNTIQANTGNGLTINALNSFDGIVNGFVVSGNTIGSLTNAALGNKGSGIALHVEADANMDVDIMNNVISNNALNGIQTSELAGSVGDLRGIGGTWGGNTITKNGFGGSAAANTTHGIWLDGTVGSALENLLIGSLSSLSGGNLIQGNAGEGILMTAPGNVEIAFNTVDTNNTGGIYLAARPTVLATIDHNLITNNGSTTNPLPDQGDGIQILNDGTFAGSIGTPDYTVVVSANTITGNLGRGINILNQGNGQTSVDIDSNTIMGNKLEGIYVVNTPAFNQSVNALGETAMAGNAGLRVIPRLDLIVNNNDVEGNGINSALTATGLVVRIGSSDGGINDPTFDDGGFYNDPLTGPRGGVGATVTNNTFHGNLGDDISFSSFTATVTPAASGGGTWSATAFNDPTSYQTVPLARLDLSFHNNTFDSTSENVGNVVNNTNVGNITGNNVAAQYSINDGVFISRINTATPPGPFASATREINAERLAGRFLGALPPFSPQLGDFLFPGMGQSTFRLLGATTAADVAAAGFITDNAPYADPLFDANGVAVGPKFDNMPYGWTFLNGVAPPARPQ